MTHITAAQRLAQELTARYNDAQRAAGRMVWSAPDILPWSAWLARCWREALREDERLLLSSLQALRLWEDIVTASPEAQNLLRPGPTARQARDAWELLQSWRLPLADIEDQAFNEDTQAFINWARQYEQRCQDQQWLDPTRLPEAVIELLDLGQLQLPKELVFSGFLEPTPQQQYFFESLTERGISVTLTEETRAQAKTVRIALADQRAEIVTSARWARRLLENAVQSLPPGRGKVRMGVEGSELLEDLDPHPNPPPTRGREITIGIVIPNLQEIRQQVETIFADILIPEAILPGSTSPRPYNISLGLPLNNYPLVHTALLWLTLASRALPWQEASNLLRSPYLAGAETEHCERALLDAELRKYGKINWDQPFLCHRIVKFGRCPILQAVFTQLQELHAALPYKLLPSRWVGVLTEMLNRAGWPGERTLSSAELQTHTAFMEIFHSLAALDLLATGLSHQEAVNTLKQYATDKIFQPESPPVPIQIMGMLEAISLRFDELWIMGMQDEIWPPPYRPNPFLPLAIQRDLRMPHASAEGELTYAITVLENLQRSATSVVMSYAKQDGDRELRVSPLIAAYPEITGKDIPQSYSPRYHEIIQQTPDLESLIDDRGPAIGNSQTIAGGTAIFKDQAACPFRAFAHHRLGARALGVPMTGLDTGLRGTLVHDTMHLLWEQLQSQEQLRNTTRTALLDLIEHCVAAVLASKKQLHDDVFTPRLSQLENERITALAINWLEFELTRPAFTVSQREYSCQIKIGEIPIKASVDRIDILEDGRTVIIDYKTGVPQKYGPKLWYGERPDDPQLPLYTLHREEPPAAVVFGCLHSRGCSFNGLSENAEMLPKVKSFDTNRATQHYNDWPALLADWRTTLEKLASDFQGGDARVDPKNASTCQYCDVSLLCRVNDMNMQFPEAAADDEQ